MVGLETQRARMVRDQLAGAGISDARVLDAFAVVPRERFVTAEHLADAYADCALPIGYGQTISQPFVVALALQLLVLAGTEHTLEVGAGSGYAAAVMSRLVRDLVAAERIPQLAARATRALADVGASNVRVLAADAGRGVAVYAPYDAILVSAAADTLPMRLYHELVDGGRMVAPIGRGSNQRLELVTKHRDGPRITESVAVRFVPLISDQP
jgi:protein-L-isoaspartate(D-aspartate) O-methyltransferase